MKHFLPLPVAQTIESLKKAGFEAYIVGGCVRDMLLKRVPKDWDITTNAKPEQIQEIFPDHVYENTFGTIGVKVDRFHPLTPPQYEHDIIEVTTYRTETGYSDHRRPDQVTFVTTLPEDLARRDFTINALAASIDQWLPSQNTSLTTLCTLSLVDPFDGFGDIQKKIIRAVGNPEQRFEEDALRIMRAIRFASELRLPTTSESTVNWHIDEATLDAIKKQASTLHVISLERIRDELSRVILSQNPAFGIELIQTTGLLKYIIPELEEGVGVGQNLHHIYTVWEHNLRALETCPSPKLHVRLAALLHDVGKPRTKKGDGYRSTFYNHDHVGARMTKSILTRLRYPRDIIDKTTLLVDNHLFYYNVGEVTEASVRRLIKKVGLENMHDLMDVRISDRLGSGVPKAKPYKLRHLEYMIDKVSHDPLSVKMLKINGQDLIRELALSPGPKIGAILDVLLAETIEDPNINTRETLLIRAKILLEHNLDDLRTLAQEKIEEKRTIDDQDIKQQHFVQ
ncbi:MAG: HDIG domain-containing protein [Candidatus Moranbacteria bacterium]|jgi:tRNA nucleotidyltransferase (CCA-adding enzyme)|nr:HDIG domain-containing protein [Candidatus Moranbacteria bacterium]MBP9801066.1 HDIG domain-containing protein [Candidatus Moranbacteria bacterium]